MCAEVFFVISGTELISCSSFRVIARRHSWLSVVFIVDIGVAAARLLLFMDSGLSYVSFHLLFGSVLLVFCVAGNCLTCAISVFLTPFSNAC